jgi:site-specific recombinase XerD
MMIEQLPCRHDTRDTLTADDISRLLNACSGRAASGIRNRAMIAIFHGCGLRVAEAIALDAGAVDRESRSLRVPEPRERIVPFDPPSFRLVERWIERRKDEGLEDAAPLLCTLHGNRLKPSYIRALLPRLARKAGVGKRVCAEALRRSLAVELARDGASIERIQQQLGHASPLTTNRFLARATLGTREGATGEPAPR